MGDDVYQSAYTGYQIIVQGAEPIFAPGTGTMIGRTKELTAEFGEFGPEVRRLNEQGEDVVDEYTGAVLTTAAIYGGVFNLQAQAQKKGWTADETELVRAKVDYQCSLTPTTVWKREKAVVVAAKPVRSYDELHHNQIPVLAEQTGMVREFLAYEVENKNRPGVVAKLQEILDAGSVEAELTAA